MSHLSAGADASLLSSNSTCLYVCLQALLFFFLRFVYASFMFKLSAELGDDRLSRQLHASLDCASKYRSAPKVPETFRIPVPLSQDLTRLVGYLTLLEGRRITKQDLVIAALDRFLAEWSVAEP